MSGTGVVTGNVFVQDGVLNFAGQIDGNLTLTAGSHFGAGDLKALVTVNGQATVAGTLEVDIAKEHFVEFNGEPIKSVKTAFKSAVKLAGLGRKIEDDPAQPRYLLTDQGVGYRFASAG